MAKSPKKKSVSPKVRSFLRWVGGKRLLATRLLQHLPADAADRRYFEPFLGAASVYFALRPKSAVLADLNKHLIECYKAIKRNHRAIALLLRSHGSVHSKKHYYGIRDAYNKANPSGAQAARFIYLNATCFNGIFRVNQQGTFNVPYGDKDNPQIPDSKTLAAVALALRPATLRCCDYEVATRSAAKGDVVYLDPPYPPINGTSYFTHYTSTRFGREDQERLATVAEGLASRGCLVMMTNADSDSIRKLYRNWNYRQLSVPRYVSCKKVRHSVDELVITNYDREVPR